MRLAWCGVLVLTAVISAASLAAQKPETAPAPPSRFEVVSIRPSGPHANANGSFHMLGALGPGEWRATGMYLPELIGNAYGLKLGTLNRIEGLPTWTQKAEYDITATIPPHARQAQIPLMVRAMLADRFHLKVHWETRPMPAGTLMLASSGLKIKPVAACDNPNLPVVLIPSRPAPAVAARKPDCGTWANAPGEDGSIVVTFHGVTMPELANYAASQTVPVLDRTGLRGAYDFTLTYPRVKLRGVSREQSSAIEAQNLRHREDAFLHQLGLKLNLSHLTKQPVPVLVVDHVNEPTPN